MVRVHRSFIWVSLLTLPFWVLGPAHAAYIEIIGLDPRSAAMGGAAAGVADTPSAWYYNPAGLAQIRGGWQEFGLAQIAFVGFKQRDPRDGQWLSNTTPTTYNIHFPGCDNYGMKNVTIGLGGGATFGGLTYWDQNRGNLRYGAYENMTLINTFTPTVAYRVNSWLMVGVGLNLVALNKLTNFNKIGDGFIGDAVVDTAKGFGLPSDVVDQLAPFLSTRNGKDDGKLELTTDEEFPTGLQPTNHMDIDLRDVSYNVGILIKPTQKLRVGITYREAVDVNYEGDAKLIVEKDAEGAVNWLLDPLGMPVQDAATRFRLRINMPRILVVGASYWVTDRLLLATDVQWTNWAAAWTKQTVYLEGGGLLGLTQLPVNRNFNDTVSVRVGAEYRIWRGLRCQAGYWWDPSPVPNSTIDAGTMDSSRHAMSFGLGYWGLFNGLIDISTVFQYIYMVPRSVAIGESENLGGQKNFVSGRNDFPLEFKGNVINVGAVLGLHY